MSYPICQTGGVMLSPEIGEMQKNPALKATQTNAMIFNQRKAKSYHE